jgi:poly-gamma-glutamate synthesis protein (capsule biosynthesis protein)
MSHSSSLKALDSDLIAVMLHWGNEYKDNPNSHQTNLAQFLVEQGADTIIGGHPHVLEPYETISVTGWDGQEREGFVCYSLGNFISGQKDLETRTTVVLDLELTKDPVTGETTITDVGYVPYYMSYRKNAAVGERYQLLDIHEAMAEYEAGESTVVDKTIYGLLKESLAHCYDVMGSEGDQKAQADQ